MNVLSLFNGISGCHLALDKAEIDYNTVYYSEIDKWANKVTEENFPNDVPLGDVTKYGDWGIDWSSIGLVTAGFPCQSWSVAGQGLGDKDERGALFWTTLEVIRKVLDNNPNAKFVMENVKMKKEFEEYITHHTEQALGRVNKTLINSALVSAQNRNRYYWTNFEVSQPQDRGQVLADVLEVPLDGKFNLPKVYTDRWIKYEKPKGNVIGTTKKEGTIGQKHNCCGVYGKMGCLTASMYKQPHQYVCDAKEIENIVSVGNNYVQWDKNLKGHKSQDQRAYYLKGKHGTLNSNGAASKCKVVFADSKQCANNSDKLLFRKLTPVECERLQNIPDNFTSSVSNTQRYKAIGNGWTIDVIAHIFKCAFEQA